MPRHPRLKRVDVLQPLGQPHLRFEPAFPVARPGVVRLRVSLILDAAERIPGVLVGADEIQRHPVLFAERAERGDPLAGAGGGAADLQEGIRFPDDPGGDFIEAEVFLPAPVPENVGQIRLVPDLEEPLPDFLQAVAVDQEAQERPQVVPPGVLVRRRHDVGPVEEAALQGPSLLLLRQLLRHEAQLHEGLHPGLQHVVIGHADGVEIILLEGLRPRQATHLHAQIVEGPHVVAEDAVEAHPLDAQLVPDELQLPGVIGPQGQQRVAGADAELPVLLMEGGRPVRRNMNTSHMLLSPYERFY